jgi:hypothetical protein
MQTQTLGRMSFSISQMNYPSHQNNSNINDIFTLFSNKLDNIYKPVEEIKRTKYVFLMVSNSFVPGYIYGSFLCNFYFVGSMLYQISPLPYLIVECV